MSPSKGQMATSPRFVGALEITTATFGGTDFTYQVRQQYWSQEANLQNNIWSFAATVGFFGFDPNPNIPKTSTVVYRYGIQGANGKPVWSMFLTSTAAEGSMMVIDCSNTNISPLTEPQPQVPDPLNAKTPQGPNQYIVSATWGTKVVTSAAQQLYSQAAFSPGNPISLIVSPDTLGPDPNPGVVKSFSVTYGSYYARPHAPEDNLGIPIGRWLYRAKVDAQGAASYQLNIPPAIFKHEGSDLWIQIYSATYGPKDYTDFVQKFYSDFRKENKVNDFLFTPSNTTFGEDPCPGIAKSFVMIYRVVQSPPNAPLSVSGALESPSNVPLLVSSALHYSTKAPISVSGLRSASAPEGQEIGLIPITEDLSPDIYVCPNSRLNRGFPWLFKAIWFTTDITTGAAGELEGQMNLHETPDGASLGLNVNVLADGDPASGVRKALTVLMGFPTNDNSGNWELVTYVVMDPAQQSEVSIPLVKQSGFNTVKFRNKGASVSWPKIVGVDNTAFLWDLRGNNSWKMLINQSKTVDLIRDAHCIVGQRYKANFDISLMPDNTPVEFLVVSSTTNILTLSINETGRVITFLEYVFRGGQLLGQLVGIGLEVIAAFAE